MGVAQRSLALAKTEKRVLWPFSLLINQHKGNNMPKVTLEFDLPEEQDDLTCALEGSEWSRVYDDIRQYVRVSYKHGHTYKSADEAIDAIYSFICVQPSERSLNENL